MRTLLCISVIALSAACAGGSSEKPALSAKIDAADSRIKNGFTRLGASEKRGACFAERISGSLDADSAEEAALIVEAATSKEDMRSKVLAASGPVRKAFIGANMRCSLFG